MTHYPQPHPLHRATRIQFATTPPALVRLDGGERTRGKIQSVSVTGGLLQLAKALEEGDFVEIAFQTRSGPVRGMAEMLHPRQISDETTLQAFRFVALEDNDHNTLSSMVDSSAERDLLLGNTKSVPRGCRPLSE